MQISNNFIAVETIQEPEQEGFKTVKIEDTSSFKGKVVHLGEAPLHMGNRQILVGDTIIFAKYSPNTHDIAELKLKFVSAQDVLAVL